MKFVIQRVKNAKVVIAEKEHASIEEGLLVLVGIDQRDTKGDVEWLCKKLVQLRIFSDEKGLLNRSVTDVQASILLVSQFSLIASYKKGNRPSFIQAARPELAKALYEYCIAYCEGMLPNKIGRAHV